MVNLKKNEIKNILINNIREIMYIKYLNIKS